MRRRRVAGVPPPDGRRDVPLADDQLLPESQCAEPPSPNVLRDLASKRRCRRCRGACLLRPDPSGSRWPRRLRPSVHPPCCFSSPCVPSVARGEPEPVPYVGLDVLPEWQYEPQIVHQQSPDLARQEAVDDFGSLCRGKVFVCPRNDNDESSVAEDVACASVARVPVPHGEKLPRPQREPAADVRENRQMLQRLLDPESVSVCRRGSQRQAAIVR
ncbi:hypothetical protein CNYM01_13191 [Colletotrichum nymphaeae SA-01]|uniref:Uncharacterized protein n=1 Tax=Colletotrichum nymphaeae SA-01 TaxID=1460502 RepID=A0A135UKT4_9PEZI|nr:hypothetical protein CNYM01_13191 [Colletotrichum nymphaeae SA-01]